MSQKAKKPRLDRSDDSDYSDQEISIHASYEDEFTIASPRFGEHRGDTESPSASQDTEMISDSEPFQLIKLKSSDSSSRKRKQRQYRSGLGEEHQGHSERERSRHRSRRDDESRKRDRYSHSHSRSPVPPRSRDRGDRPHRGDSLKRELSSGRNSPMYIDERSRDSLRDEPRYGGREGVELEEGGRYHERLSGGSSRLLTVREDSRRGGGERRGSREIKEILYEHEHGGHHRKLLKPIRSSSVRVGGERGSGGYPLLRDDRRHSLKGSRSSPRRPIEFPDRGARSGRHEMPSASHHYSHSAEREHQHHKEREEHRAREGHHKGHRHRNRREAAGEERESSTVASTVETMITISSGSGGEDELEEGERRGREKIEDLIRDIESGSSSSGEISDGESEGEGRASPASKDDASSSEKSSDGEIHSPSPAPERETQAPPPPHKIRSKFDSDPESESEDERSSSKRRRSPPSSSSLGHPRGGGGGYSGYHDTVTSEEEQSEDELAHGPSEGDEESEEGPGDKENDLSAQLSRELGEVERSPTPEKELPCYLPALMGCRSVEENYDYLNKIEEGTYGVVHRAKDKKTGKVFALKRLKLENEKEGFPITSLREIDMLLKAKHPNIVGVREIVLGKNLDRIYIVFEYVEHDLKELMETMKQPFLQGEVKTLMIQLLRAVHHLHDNWIIHRDLKASNLLVSHQAILKVADFGLAREYGSPLRKYTPIVVTLWYRSPELLLGAPEYSTPVDMWSVGCIFAEMMLQKPLFQGKGEIDQLNQIFKLLGTPNEQIWNGYNELPTVKKVTFANQPYNHLRKKFPPSLITQNGFDLLNRFLTYDPKKRITAKDALEHPYFKEPPMPIPPSMFNTWPAKSEMGHKKKAKSPTPPVGGAFQFAEDGPGFNLKF